MKNFIHHWCGVRSLAPPVALLGEEGVTAPHSQGSSGLDNLRSLTCSILLSVKKNSEVREPQESYRLRRKQFSNCTFLVKCKLFVVC